MLALFISKYFLYWIYIIYPSKTIEFITTFSEVFSHGDVFHILLLILAASWIMGRLFSFFNLPPVLGDIIAGVIISPFFFSLDENTSVQNIIEILAQLGVFFLMLHSGLDSNIKELSSRFKQSVIISLCGIIPVFTALFCLFHFFFPRELVTELFLAAVLSLNSIPILISFLKFHKEKNTEFGHLVIGSTIINELLLFLVISFLLIFAQSGEVSVSAGAIIFVKITLFFIGTLFLGKVVMPLFAPILNKINKKAFTLSMIIALIFGLFAEFLGLHIILGAYLGGMFMREQLQNESQFKKIEDRLYGLSYSFLGPIFFVSVGISLSFSIVLTQPLLFLSVFIIIMGMQIIGSGLAAYIMDRTAFTWKRSAALGATLAGRGGTEIIIAKVGLTTFLAGTSIPLITASDMSLVVFISFSATLLIPLLLHYLLAKKQKTSL